MHKINKISIGIGTMLFMLLFSMNVLAADCPRVNLGVIPGIIQPGANITLQAQSEGYSADGEDQDRMNYMWCIDKVPLNTLNAGSSDKIAGNEVDGYYLQSEYGDIGKDNLDKICNPGAALAGGFTSQKMYKIGDDEAYCLRNDNKLYCNAENLVKYIGTGHIILGDRITIFQEGDNETLPFRRIGNISYENYVKNSAPPEFYVTRQPTIGNDTDGDGLDDNWEIRYFKGKLINYTTENEDGSTEKGFFYMPDNDEALLPLVQPDKIVSPDDPSVFVNDPDGDAWEYFFKDEGNNYSAPWMLGVPYLRSSVGQEVNPGQKSFDILREYIEGTNPTTSDTDNDGVEDGLDYIGIKQDNVHLIVKKEYGEKYNVMLRVFGVNDKYRNENSGDKYTLFTYPAPEDTSCGFEATPKGENEIEVGLGLALKVGWSYNPAPPIPGDPIPITVIAETSKLEENAGLDLEFKWFLNGHKDEDVVEEGYGKKIYQYNTEKQACDRDTIGLEILEKNTNRLNFQEFEIPIGFDSSLDMDVIGNVDLKNEEVKKFNERKGIDFNDINFDDPNSENYILKKSYILDQDAFKGKITEDQGFRTGDLVKATVNKIKDGFGDECKNKYKVEDEKVKKECETKYGIENCDDPFELAVQNFNFKWNFKGKEQQLQSGKGPNFETAYFILRDDPRSIGEPTGEEANSLANTSSEAVTLEVLDDKKDIIARNDRNFEIKPPSIEFDDPEGVEIGTSPEDSNQSTYYAGDSNVTIHASLNYWRPSREFTYTWKRNGEAVDTRRGDWNTTESSYTFKPGVDINGQPNGLNKEIITLEVESKINYVENNGNPLTETASKTREINLSNPEVDRENLGVAGALSKFIPQYYKNVFNLFFVFGLTGLVTLFIIGFMYKASGRK